MCSVLAGHIFSKLQTTSLTGSRETFNTHVLKESVKEKLIMLSLDMCPVCIIYNTWKIKLEEDSIYQVHLEKTHPS